MKIPAAPRSEDELELSKWRWNVTKYFEQTGDDELFIVRTEDATVTTLGKITLDDESSYLVEAIVVGKKSDSTDRAAYIRRTLAFRDAGGNATLQGAVSAPETLESNVAWDATLDVSGNDVRIRVTGAAATTIDWKGIIRYLAVKPARL